MGGEAIAIALNGRFLSSGEAGIPYGAVGFTRGLSRELRARGHSVGYVLYRRDVHSLRPTVIAGRECAGAPVAEVAFSFAAEDASIRQGFEEAIESLRLRSSAPPVLYHQTGVTLPYTPRSVRCMVTHHAPFVEDVLSTLGESEARRAFAGSPTKVSRLGELQQRGLDWLRSTPAATAVELTATQRRRVLDAGIAEDQCFLVPPPIAVVSGHGATISHEAREWLAEDGIRVMSAAARLDGFKNVEQIVDACRELRDAGHPVRLYLAVGGANDRVGRRAIVQRAGTGAADWLWIEPRLAPAQLAVTFQAAAGRAVFAFPSLYETLGLTPLEAVSCGVDVAVPGDPTRIGALQYLSSEFLYDPFEPAALGRKILELRRSGDGTPRTGGLTEPLSLERYADRFEEIARGTVALDADDRSRVPQT